MTKHNDKKPEAKPAAPAPTPPAREVARPAAQKPTPGRIVLYKLSQYDINCIESQRGAKGVRGNPMSLGDPVPMIVVRIFENEFGEGIPGVNGKVMLDGEDSFWATSRREGNEAGEWSWPARA